MLGKIVFNLVISFVPLFSFAATDLGDVVVCPGKTPTALFAQSQSFDLNNNQDFYISKIKSFSPALSKRIISDALKVTSSLRWTSGKLKNSDGESLNGCGLQQLYQKNKTLGGAPFYVVDKPLYEALSLSEQSVFIIEMALFINHDSSQLDDLINKKEILKAEQAILVRQAISPIDWLDLIPKSWDSTKGFESCFIPAEFFDSLFCLHSDFLVQKSTGSLLPFDGEQLVPLFGNRVFAESVGLINGRIELLHWQSPQSRGIRHELSLIYPEFIKLKSSGLPPFEVRLKSHLPSSIICENQRLSFRQGVLFVGLNGCIVDSLWAPLLEGEARSRDGLWHPLDTFSDHNFDSEGFLVK